MKALVLSDIHCDMWFQYANEPKEFRVDDPIEEVTYKTMDYLWDTIFQFPETDAIIIPGDIANDFLTFTREINWLSKKYKEVYFVPGNHDILVRGATPSQSNLQFKTSEEKIDAMRKECDKYPNVHFLNGDVVNNVAGCMGMNDFKCEPCYYMGSNLARWRRWFDCKHWKYFHNDPAAIWNYYDKTMTELCEKKPKIIVTHFAPYQVGVNFKYRMSNLNEMFYFNAEKYLEMLDDGTIWCCGHIHDKKHCEYYNKNGNKITILCNPLGYPGENDNYCDFMIIPKDDDKLVRSSGPVDKNFFIVEI